MEAKGYLIKKQQALKKLSVFFQQCAYTLIYNHLQNILPIKYTQFK